MDLKRVTEITDELKLINEEIEIFDKLAEKLANNDCRLHIRLEDFDKKAELESKEKTNFDMEDLVIKMFGGRYSTTAPKETHVTDKQFEINDTLALTVLAIILRDRLDKREVLLKLLKKHAK